MRSTKSTARNPTGRHGKPIKLPPTTFEDAVKKMLTTPLPSKQTKPKRSAASKKHK